MEGDQGLSLFSHRTSSRDAVPKEEIKKVVVIQGACFIRSIGCCLLKANVGPVCQQLELEPSIMWVCTYLSFYRVSFLKWHFALTPESGHEVRH